MLSIRLKRMGKKKYPVYRVIVLDKRKDPWGDYIENLGHYNPHTKPNTVKLKEERIKYWLSVGAQPSPTVHNLLVDAKIIDGPKVKATTPKKKKKQPEEASPQPANKTEQNTSSPEETKEKEPSETPAEKAAEKTE